MKMLQFEIGLDDLESLINRLNTEMGFGLIYHGRNERVAVWSVGNYSIVAHKIIDTRLTELETDNFNGVPDEISQKARDNLIERLNRSGITHQKNLDLARVAHKTLTVIAERAFRKDITIEQVVERFLGRQKQAIINLDIKTYKLSRPINKGDVTNFYNRLGDYAEDNEKRLLYHFVATHEMLNGGRAHITFGINGDKGNISISTDNGYLHLKAFVYDDYLLQPWADEWTSLHQWFMENGWFAERSSNLELETTNQVNLTREPEKPHEKRIDDRGKLLNQLAVMWVKHNQTERISKYDDKKSFLNEYADQLGINGGVTLSEFNKWLPKAYKIYGVIDKDTVKNRYIPKIGNSNGNT